MNLDRELLSGILFPDYDKDVSQLDKYRLVQAVRHEFAAANKPVFNFVERFFEKFSKFPKPDTIKDKFPAFNIKEPKEPYRYFLDEAVQMRMLKDIQQSINKVEQRIASEDRRGAIESFIESARSLTLLDVTSKDVDFKESFESFLADYLEKQSGIEDASAFGLSVGLPTIDEETGGLLPGDYWTVLGRPGSMKSYSLCKFAVEFADQVDGNVLFVSKEMVASHIYGRMMALVGEQSYAMLRKYKLDEETIEGIHKKMMRLKGNIKITDEVRDVMGIKPKAMEHQAQVLIIDGLYLFAKEDDWREVAKASRTARNIALELKIPSVSSVQFNRKGSKKMHIDNAAFSDAIGQDASVVLGQQRVYDEVLEKPLNQIKMEILKSRDGATGKSLLVSIDFQKSLFQEGDSEEVEEFWTFDKMGSTTGLAENEVSSV